MLSLCSPAVVVDVTCITVASTAVADVMSDTIVLVVFDFIGASSVGSACDVFSIESAVDATFSVVVEGVGSL